ncbi:HlyD family efflux transporter periplasmic adaptor subunit [Luteibacter sp. dw_328]|uniref:HlyD family efflux transporter periplasmic adaptor subunit n=1 Tax=Luteibacter sp. dw_328 TaxID=2719796 RepID=UPI001BD5FE9F|nr:HlyD family efflux transporter periplasmic adaptor subunit [Luteibacter sp. dw_328]
MIHKAAGDLDSRRPLFRLEVSRARREDWLGTVLLVAPVRRWVVAALSVALGTSVLAFLFFAHYTRRETVSGVLIPDAGLMNVVAVAPGTLVSLRVHSGQRVKAGDILLEISSDRDSASLGSAGDRLAAELQRQRAGLESDLANQRHLVADRVAAIDDRLRSLRSQSSDLDAQIVVQQRLVKSGDELLEKIRPLAGRGYVSAVQIQQQEASVLEAQSRYRELTRQRSALGQDINAATSERAQLPMQDLTDRNDTERRLADVAQAMTRNEVDRGVVLRAPHDGVISALLGRPGQPVLAGQTMLTILPDGAALVARLLVPSRAIGFVETKHRVVLRYQAFPYQKFGLQYGRVIEVSRSALSPSEVSTMADLKTDEPMYTVQVGLDRQAIAVNGHDEMVRPGMAVDADILMERRRLAEWVFEPLFGAVRRAGGAGP